MAWRLRGCKMKMMMMMIDDDENGEDIGKENATKFRRSVARLNYMALDRQDIGNASKEFDM